MQGIECEHAQIQINFIDGLSVRSAPICTALIKFKNLCLLTI